MFVGIYVNSFDSGFGVYKTQKISGNKTIHSIKTLDEIVLGESLFGDSPVYVCNVSTTKILDNKICGEQGFDASKLNIIFVFTKQLVYKRLQKMGVTKFIDCRKIDLMRIIKPTPDKKLVNKIYSFAGNSESILLEFIKFCENTPPDNWSFTTFTSFCVQQGKYSPQMLMSNIYKGDYNGFMIAYNRAINVGVPYLASSLLKEYRLVLRIASAYHVGNINGLSNIIPPYWGSSSVYKYGKLLSQNKHLLGLFLKQMVLLDKYTNYFVKVPVEVNNESFRVCLLGFVDIFANLMSTDSL